MRCRAARGAGGDPRAATVAVSSRTALCRWHVSHPSSCRSSGECGALREVAADPRHFGAEIGVLSILHTWGQTLVRIHTCTVCATGGFS